MHPPHRRYQKRPTMPSIMTRALGLTACLVASAQAVAAPCCDPSSPFRAGEGYADVPASCETIEAWLDRAPEDDQRISMTIHGELAHVQTDGVLAYLVMCADDRVQVMCVTYKTNGMKPGDTVRFGGGFSRVGERQAMLDPCLADRL